jgi:2-isopropylmalate synthase
VDLRRHVQAYADHAAKELSGEEVWGIFRRAYVERAGPIRLLNYWPRPADHDPRVIQGEVHLEVDGNKKVLNAEGNGPISAFVHALRLEPSVPDFQLDEYEEETRGRSADAEAICFVRLNQPDEGTSAIGVGFGSNIDQAAVAAVCSAVNSLAHPVTREEILTCSA